MTKPIHPSTLDLGRFKFEIRNGEVYSVNGRYYYDTDLWNNRIEAGKRPQYDHDFFFVSRVEEDLGQWTRTWAQCRRCGEERKVFPGGPHFMRTLNSMWCVKPPKPQRFSLLRYLGFKE